MKGYTQKDLSERGFAAKQDTRERALDIVTGSCLLWDDLRGQLSTSWMELSGPDAPTLQMLLDHDVLGPGCNFYGVDTNPDVLRGCQERYAHIPQAQWIEGDIARIVEHYKDVGVLVFDSWNAMEGADLEDSFEKLALFAHEQFQRLGEFLLIVNVSTAYRQGKDALEKYPALLEAHFSVPVRTEHLHKYTSSKTPMIWVALRWGF